MNLVQITSLKFRITCSAIALAASFSTTAQAQDSASAETEAVGGHEILVTAERRNARMVETPITLTALSDKQLAQSGVTGVLDLTKVVPGLKMDQYGSSVFPAIRGITTTVEGVGVSSNVAVYLDGFYISAPAALNFEFPDIQNVQVLKGPQGTLFGRNATGGAILFTTKEPTGSVEGQVTIGYGTYDEKVANGYVAGPLADRLAASLSFTYRDSDGYVRNIVTGQRDGTYKGWNVRGKLKFEATDWLDLKLQVEHTYINDPMSMVFRVERPNAISDFVDGAIVTRDRYKIASDITTVLAKNIDNIYFTAKADIGKMTLSSLTGYANEKYNNVFDFDGSSLEAANFQYISNVETVTQELILAGSSETLDWSIGGFYLYQDGDMPFAAVNGFAYISSGVKSNAIAGYADATYNIASKLFVTAGIRYSHEKKRLNYHFMGGPDGAQQASWSSWTPRAVMRYQFDRDTSLYASYSKGFAAGVYSAFTPAGPVADPEDLDAFEIGFKHSRGRLSFDAAAFRYIYKDMQSVLYTVGPNGVESHLANIGKAQIYGLEGSLRAELNDAISIFAGGAYTHSKYKNFDGTVRYQPLPGGGYEAVSVSATGNRLLRSPRLTGNAGFNVHLPLAGGGVDFGGSVYAVSKTFNDPANDLPISAYGTVDLRASWTSGDRLWKIGVIGKNVLDEHHISYWDPSNAGLLVNDSSPRTIRITFTRKF